MRWKSQDRRKEYELWEMTTSHIENCIRMINVDLIEWQGAQSRFITQAVFKWEIRKKFLQRELQYRSNEDYRLLAGRLRKNKNDSTLYNAFADKCIELGYFVMARRLQRKGRAIIDALIRAEKMREIICNDSTPELLAAAKNIGYLTAKQDNERFMNILKGKR